MEGVFVLEICKVMKLCLKKLSDKDAAKFMAVSICFRDACNFESQYVFDNGFPLNALYLQECLYQTVREKFGLKSQMAISVFKTVVARYKAVQTQMEKEPYKYRDENGKWVYIERTLEWLWYPIRFKKPQCDLVSGRDWSFAKGKLSINTLEDRVKAACERPFCYEKYFDGTWKFTTAKLVKKGKYWYLHVSVTKEAPDTFDRYEPSHITGIDRGIRNEETIYDEEGKTTFISGKEDAKRREQFLKTRAELQSRGTKSAKRVLKRISGRENRWMTDKNHKSSKTLCEKYQNNTLYTLEDLTGVSFSEENLSRRDAAGRYELRSWPFYQFEEFLTYKAHERGSEVVKVKANYTSRRCPHCGRIRKENRNHEKHENVCDWCGFRTNDDRLGSMNIFVLGERYSHGEDEPEFVFQKPEKTQTVKSTLEVIEPSTQHVSPEKDA